MRKGITRDKINRTFTLHRGKAEFYDRQSGKRVKKKFEIYTDRKDFEKELSAAFPDPLVLLRVMEHAEERVTFSMTPEEFRKHATVY